MWIGRIAIVAVLAQAAWAEPVQTERSPTRVAAAWTIGGIGAASLATGIALGLWAKSEYDQQFKSGVCARLDATDTCEPAGYANTQQARTLGNVATGFGIAGTAAIAAAAIVYLTAPEEPVAVVPVVDGHSAGVGVSLRF